MCSQWYVGNPNSDQFHKVKMPPKWSKPIDRKQNVISSEDHQETSRCRIRPFLSCVLIKMTRNPKFDLFRWSKCRQIRISKRPLLKSNQFWKKSGNIIVLNFRPFLSRKCLKPTLKFCFTKSKYSKMRKINTPGPKSNRFLRWSGIRKSTHSKLHPYAPGSMS